MITLSQLVILFKANVFGIIATLAFCPLAIWIARRGGLIDVPGSAAHKQHAAPVPLAGGIAIALSILVLALILRMWQKDVIKILIAAAIVFVFGLWDDAKGLRAPVKLLGQVLASTLLIASDVSVHFLEGLSLPLLSGNILTSLDWGITILWFVGMTNAFNLIDSMDGLVVGIAGIAFAFFMGMALISEQAFLAQFSAAFFGICIGLFVFNVSPARLFLGDAGAQTLGFVLAAVAMIYSPGDLPQASSWFVPVMALGVPIFDTTLVVVSRFIRHKPIFQADRTHTYHRLCALGIDSNRAVLMIHVAALLLNFLAFATLSFNPLWANLVFGATICIGVGILIFLERRVSIS